MAALTAELVEELEPTVGASDAEALAADIAALVAAGLIALEADASGALRARVAEPAGA